MRYQEQQVEFPWEEFEEIPKHSLATTPSKKPSLDPTPWVSYGGERESTPRAWEGSDFMPRKTYSQNIEDYGQNR